MFYRIFLYTVYALLLCLSSFASDIIKNNCSRFGDLEVAYKDGSEFRWSQYGEIVWRSGNIKYSMGRFGDVSLSCGEDSYTKDRHGSTTCLGKFSQVHTDKIWNYLSKTGKKPPLCTIANIIGDYATETAVKSDESLVQQYSRSDIIKNNCSRFGDLEVAYKDGSEFRWSQYGEIVWHSGKIKYSKGRFGDVSLSCGEDSYTKDRFGSTTCLGKFSEVHTDKILNYLSKTGKKPPLCTIASIIGDNATKTAVESDEDLVQQVLKLSLVENIAAKNPELPNNQMSSSSKNDADDLCIICMDEKTDRTAVLSCGHMNTCATCREKLVKNEKVNCPTCRQSATIIRIYH